MNENTEKLKIYVASSWKNEFQPNVVQELRKAGFEVYDFRNPIGDNTGFSWTEVDPEWKKWSCKEYDNAVMDNVAQAGFHLDYNAINQSDTCVLVLPAGRSAHLEACFMAGQGKFVVVYFPFEMKFDAESNAELMYKLTNYITMDFSFLVSALKKFEKSDLMALRNRLKHRWI